MRGLDRPKRYLRLLLRNLRCTTMGKFSTYRYLQLHDDTSNTLIAPRARAQRQPIRFRRLFVFLVVAMLVVTYILGLFAGQNLLLDGIANTLGYNSEYHYAVIIDAGSSGSRVLAYNFRVPFTVFNRGNLQLEREYFEQSKPGLSSYADEPQKGAETIVKLINNAGSVIPVEARARTPLIVRATAGLRLLPQEKADLLIETVRQAISKLGYDVGSDAVQIMAGADEGIYIWYTINLLRELFHGDTMTALDLGGGSTQITYRADPPKDAKTDYYSVPLVDRNLTVYTHSYLNLGLYAARLAILRLENPDMSTTVLKSSCVEPIIENELWHYGNRDYNVSGVERSIHMQPQEAFLVCREIVARHVKKIMFGDGNPPPTPQQAPVAAMSFFYDIAADAGLIDVMTGGTITVDQYREKAVLSCSSSNVEQPWSCLDLVFVVSLLRDGYKFDHKKKINLFKKVKNYEVSWGLGLAYTTVTNRLNNQ